MWDHEHNRRHHRFNNIRRLDSNWEPMTLEDYRRASLGQRLLYQFYRDPGGGLFYYLIELWLKCMIVPNRRELVAIRPVHVIDAALVWCFALLQVAVAVMIGAAFGKSALASITLAVVVPFLVLNMLISLAIKLHHTNPRVPWYRDIDEWRADHGAMRAVVHIEFPWLMRVLFLNIMEHPAHHYAPGVPLYRLHDMQMQIAGPSGVAERFSIPRYFAICARCKLFDYDTGQWRNFRGEPTSPRLLATVRGRDAA
jgi:omega-6 fatty acid desaturase (delta-12 desaturase)